MRLSSSLLGAAGLLSLLVPATAQQISPGPPSSPIGPGGLTPGCDPPLPGPGQTVHWIAPMSPVQICSSSEIPAGATVVVGPGVVLEVKSGVTLTVAGELHGLGKPAAPIALVGAGRIQVHGRMTADHARLDLDVDLGSRASLRLTSSTVVDGNDLSTFARDALVDLEGVVIEHGTPFVFGQLALRDVEYLDPGFWVEWTGYVLADHVTVHGAPVTVVADHQPRLLSDVDVWNPGANPALTTSGGGITPGTNVLVDGACDLVGGTFPVNLRVGGLHPDSVLPLTGNATNAIDVGGAGAGSGVCDLPDLGLPYHATDDVSVQGRPRFGPGAVFEFGDFAGFEIRGDFFNDTGLIRGAPWAPLVIRPLFPGATHAGAALFNSTAEYLDVEGGRISSISGFNHIRECTVRGSALGIFADNAGYGVVRGCRILDNDVGVEDDPSFTAAIDMNGHDRPNVLSGNTIAAVNNPDTNGNAGPFAAEMNWWGHASGPYSPWTNPTGLGDEIGFGVEAVPWRTTAPDLSDAPPYVTLRWPFLLCEPADTILVSWDVEDDGRVVSQRILMDVTGGGIPAWVPIASGLPASRRSAFVEIPFIGQTADARSTILRVEATDQAGNVGVNDVTLQVPILHRPDGTVGWDTDLSQGFLPAEERTICYDAMGMPGGSSGVRIFLVMDTEENVLQWGPNGWAGPDQCTFSSLRFPRVSTDRARFLLFADGPGNDNAWYFSEPFAVRPLADFPDAPPQVEMVTPADGQDFAGGDTVSLTWNASDDEGLREHRIQASFNDGRTWSTIEVLPGDARAHEWVLPPLGSTLDHVRVRVVAVDYRFQASTDGDQRALRFVPGGI